MKTLSIAQTHSSEIFMLDTENAARYMGVSRQFLEQDRVTRRHGVPFHKLGRVVRYKRADLDAWLSMCRHDGS